MKLHIGGMEKKEGWKILNIQSGGEAGFSPNDSEIDFKGDITDLGQFEDNSIEEIYASHILEHVPIKQVSENLNGIYRVLKDNGKFYVSVPDMDILCRQYLSIKGSKARFHIIRMIFGGQTDEYDFHYFGYNFDLLNNLLKKNGFKDVKRVQKFSIFNDTSNYAPYGEPISLNLIAIK